jgi:membrane-associated phospholipid phosphatase
MGLYDAVSLVLSPPFVGLYVTILLSLFSPIGLGELGMLSSIALGSLFLFIVPLVSVMIFSRNDINIRDRKKRFLPYMTSIFGYLAGTIVFLHFGNVTLLAISVTYLAVSIASILINFYWKVSGHTAGVASSATALFYVFGIIAAPLYLLVPLISIVRVRMKAHSIWQVTVGSIDGIIITLAVYSILW